MKLHIGNLSKEITDAQLSDLVAPFGDTTLVELAKERDGASKGFGFAVYGNDEHAQAAIAALNGKELEGLTLKVGEARPRKTDRVIPNPVATT